MFMNPNRNSGLEYIIMHEFQFSFRFIPEIKNFCKINRPFTTVAINKG